MGVLILSVSGCVPGRVKVKLAAPVPGAGWPQTRLNDANTAFVDGPARLPDVLLWEAKTGGAVRAEPTADRGLIIAPSENGRLNFYNAATGKRIHREEFSGPPTGAVFAGDSLAFAVDAKKPRFYLWNIARQSAGRELEIARTIAPPLRLPEGWLLQTYAGKLIRTNENGDTVWTQQFKMPLMIEPAYVEGRVYLVTGGKRVSCIEVDDGTIVWDHFSAGGHAGSPAVDEMVYFGSLDSNFYALDIETGEMRWFFHTGGQVFTSPAVDEQYVYFGANSGFFYALDKRSGDLVWKLAAGLVHNSSPVVWGSTVIFGTSDGRLLVVDAAVGRIIREFHTRGSINSAPIIYQDRVYVTDAKHRLYCFGPADKTR
jgi:outer membrane protein assembly factor BamB